ncbi:cytochrome o ubiquinol oxidase operon protein cyoD [Novosphingobium sp. SG751A]|uniref:cytochrome o ubiquinol oxidase subunit IV n=1 Tax=Novosphingobium sp. SG751A TaxID=2587000 RepID=UPI0015580C57|nr:cytochrome o ubiquinol oxidase subunit IV [Novosphingobium sp. SG751A]NOW47741.1 cytochrome o ubiquinol oxidase operon protein cyoD [Novosphingobium sp. SG751A]
MAHTSSHGTAASILWGFLLSLILTALAFGAVMGGAVPRGAVLPAITLLAVAQLIVQLVFFLHLGPRQGQRGNTAIFLMTAMLIGIVVSGSLWVMYNANHNMSPTQMTIAAARNRD